MDGGGGNDVLDGGARQTSARRAGQDVINGRSGADRLYGDDGDDDLKGDGSDAPAPTSSTAGGIDTINGEWEGAVAIDVSSTGWRMTAARRGRQRHERREDLDHRAGQGRRQRGSDDIYLSGGERLDDPRPRRRDVVKGGDGDETIDGGAGADSVIGGRGNDTLIGGAGPDRIFGDNDAGGCGPIICSTSRAVTRSRRATASAT